MSTIDMAFLSGEKDNPEKAPLGLSVAAIYLIIATGISVILFILNPSEGMPERSFAQKAGTYTWFIAFHMLFLISGIGILKKKSWARKIAIWIIPITTLFSIYSWFNWQCRGINFEFYEPLIFSVLTFGWNGIWFYLIFRKSSKDYLLQKTSQPIAQADRKG